MRINALPPVRRTIVNLPWHFNAGLIDFNGLHLLSRKAISEGSGESNVCVTPLDTNTFQPLAEPRQLSLYHPFAATSREDPRGWIHEGLPRVAFTGVDHAQRVRMVYAELDAGFNPTKVHGINYGGPVEKNWTPFSIGPRQFFVYSIRPHRVLEVVGSEVVATYETPNPFPWSGRHLRGGAPPVLLPGGDRYGVCFHGCDAPAIQNPAERWEQGRVYNVGYYEFEATPPFRIIRQSPDPLLWAKDDEIQRPAYGTARVVFPCGAVLRDGRWLVSAGVGDRYSEVMEWNLFDLQGV
jgi:hypothetical protein